MALGNQIIISAEPKGVRISGKVTGTPKPGTVMQIDVSEAVEGGRFTWEAYNKGANGDAAIIAVLLEDYHQGKLATDAYVAGDRCELYIPANGEELNMLVDDVSGTGSDAFVLGDTLMVQDGTGRLIAVVGTPQSQPFDILEANSGGLTADTLKRCQYTGH